jgi:hypothetical protein
VNINTEQPVAIYVTERAVPDHQHIAIVDDEKDELLFLLVNMRSTEAKS